MHTKEKCLKIDLPNSLDLPLFHKGPPLSYGPCPSVFYFSVSGEETLQSFPFNQPVEILSKYPVRIFSITLPCHEKHIDKNKALYFWAQELSKNKNIISEFVNKTKSAIDFLIKNEIILENKIAVMALSRGFLPAMHLVSQDKRLNNLLGFAPLIDLGYCKEFQDIKNTNIVNGLNYKNITNNLPEKNIRLYLGNQDTRVGTENGFLLINEISTIALKEKKKPPQAELIITPSIGYMGHGTTPETFKNGAEWILNKILPEKFYDV